MDWQVTFRIASNYQLIRTLRRGSTFGKFTFAVVPFFKADSMEKFPPENSARSLMPTSPRLIAVLVARIYHYLDFSSEGMLYLPKEGEV